MVALLNFWIVRFTKVKHCFIANTCIEIAEKSKTIIIKGMNIHRLSAGFQMWGSVVFVGIIRTNYNRFPLAQIKFSKKAFNWWLPAEINFAGVFLWINSKMRPPFLLRSILKGLLKHSRTNWSSGKCHLVLFPKS